MEPRSVAVLVLVPAEIVVDVTDGTVVGASVRGEVVEVVGCRGADGGPVDPCTAEAAAGAACDPDGTIAWEVLQ